MNEPDDLVPESLAHQALWRPLTSAEHSLARALEEIYAAGLLEFPAVVEALEQRHIPRPSGRKEPWSLKALEEELKRINDSLDEAHLRRSGAPGG
jgi:hypothetical protein